MKRTILVVLGTLAVSASMFAQADKAAIDKALTPVAANDKEKTTVIEWKPDFTYETLQKGTNKLVCYDLSGKPGQRTPFAVECTSLTNLDRVAQNLKFNSIADAKERNEKFAAAEKDGSRVKPEFGSVWIHVMGQDAEHTRKHITVAVPGATGQSLGVPESGAQGGIWVMNAGTTTAHLMIPEN